MVRNAEKSRESILDFSLYDNKKNCAGCEGCVQVCPFSAILLKEDEYGFRYPIVDNEKCVNCGLCKKVCPIENKISLRANRESYGGFILDKNVRRQSTSGGAASALICAALELFANRISIYGAVANGIIVQHESARSLEDSMKFCSSKYVQSSIRNCYIQIQSRLNREEYVLFVGTPCQVAGLYNYLLVKNINYDKLITIEVLCAGVATPILFRKYEKWIESKYHSSIKNFYWRYKDKNRWDYNCCMYELMNGRKIVIDRWFSGYWSLFTQRLLMRPSCEICPYKGSARAGDITLGDLWGVDKEYPELYNNNQGTSWILINSGKGTTLFSKAKKKMTIQPVSFEQMKKYQIPSISGKSFHPRYSEFMEDLKYLDYPQLCKKWAKGPTIKLLFQKYIYNNQRRVQIWKLKQMIGYIFRLKTGIRK